jgi:hypothetical protein
MPDDIFRYTAEDDTFKAPAAVAPHDNQVNVFALNCLDNFMARVAHYHFSPEIGTTLEVLVTNPVHQFLCPFQGLLPDLGTLNYLFLPVKNRHTTFR